MSESTDANPLDSRVPVPRPAPLPLRPRPSDRTARLANSGRIAEAGSHDQLMDLGGHYAAIFTLHAGGYQPRSAAA
ncbi:hypothetical protein ABT009_36795 [Streptomyces sp. NPDC002896]|uniref:hypothetical protein n=1 Tax=Streptomyces sp. NPDC002896 TaxID=3154438 RepID=UPI00331E4320